MGVQAQQTLERWVPDYETDAVKPEHWRKSSQWSMLLRKHAEARSPSQACMPMQMQHCMMRTNLLEARVLTSAINRSQR